MILSLLLTLALQSGDPLPFTVEVESLDGETWCTVQAENQPLSSILTELGQQLDVRIEGMDAPELSTPVTIDMRMRPLARVLDASLGSVGLRIARRGNRWTIRGSMSETLSADELREMSMIAYLRATRSYPNHPEAAGAEMSQGELQMERGNHSAAKDHFDNLVRAFPESDQVPQALMRAGTALQELGDWSQAAKRYEDLLHLDFASEFESRARLELARCNAEMGEWQRSLFMLDALESNTPPSDAAEGQDRILIRAKALIRAQEYAKALERLGEMNRYLQTPAQDVEALRLRASALERMGAYGEAGRAWLATSLRTEGEEREHAKAKAAELALQAGDELGALLVTGAKPGESGEPAGEDDRLGQLGREAIDRLGLGSDAIANTSVELEARRGARLVEEGNYLEAISVLRPLTEKRDELGEQRSVDVFIAYARCVEQLGDVADVVRFLRAEVPGVLDSENRRRIYLFAAEMFERHEMLDEAVAAYRGRL